MDNLIAWLGTPGLIIIGSLVILYFKKKKDAEDAEEERKQLERKKRQKSMSITETKKTVIRNLDKDTFEKMSNKNNL